VRDAWMAVGNGLEVASRRESEALTAHLVQLRRREDIFLRRAVPWVAHMQRRIATRHVGAGGGGVGGGAAAGGLVVRL